ncbi:amidophosphoribosyltransferase [Saccharicrinis sp. FJH62]|uniref:amidophosphoribosyltransferase n=1 Tax=Saccharicrinis sp. FJH62 TaxID=3344657 RepID=UPI0035D45D37
MSDQIKHECGIALIRLLKPIEYYKEKYGSWMYGLNRLYLMMEKQHNRGQDGAGVVSVKIDQRPGTEYIFRERSIKQNPIQAIFKNIYGSFDEFTNDDPSKYQDIPWVKDNLPFIGDVYLGHLRYGTFGRNSVDFCHPVMRNNNWKSRNLALAGNFNMTNVDEIFNHLIELGQHPKSYTDTETVLENIGHFLDEENQFLFRKFKNERFTNREISSLIEKNLDIAKIMEQSSKRWDGGYVIAGIIGHGDAFVTRDPWGIRPAFYYKNDEVVVVASERPVIQTAFKVRWNEVSEVQPGHALIIKKDGTVSEEMVRVPHKRQSCSFERIYFSRGSDKMIYNERKHLGELLIPQVMEAVDHDIENTVFSYIPNTAETAFLGMMRGLEKQLNEWKIAKLKELGPDADENEIHKILSMTHRSEKIAVKDVKMRTFITDDDNRDEMVAHVYDVTYGIVQNEKDNLVIIDDSIVRGTTLKQSILKILDRLHPKKIVIVSSAPQIRYPDCYGIDMAKLGDFCAFSAAIQLLKDQGKQKVIDDVYEKCKAQQYLPKEEIVNYVKEIYAGFTDEEVSAKIAQMLTPEDMQAEVQIVYQTVENLHVACPNDRGDWYFTGDYPTPGGNKVVNTAFINYIEGKNQRAY